MQLLQAFLKNWLERHATGFNRLLHAVGIPMTLIGIGMLFAGRWGWALILFVGGYALQFFGHAQEGSEVGELMALKRLFQKK